MVAPFPVQNSASQLSLPPSSHHPKLKNRVSLSSIANTIRRRKSHHQNRPAHSKSYTKANGPCTLSLYADHETSSGLPTFSSGAVISGSLEISKVSKTLQSIQMMVTGRVIVQELGGPGTGESIIFSHVFYEWSRESNSPLPPALIPLSYPLPSKYIDNATGLEHQIPPTYKARLDAAVPGLRVKVQYDLSAKIVRSRRKFPFMTKTTSFNLQAPFVYRPRHHLLDRVVFPANPRFRPGSSHSRPGSAHSAHRGHGNGQAQKIFVYTSPSLHDERATEIKLYLPYGQVCALDESIPFVIKVFAADNILEELHSSVPPVMNPKDDYTSFHPIGPDPSKIKRPRTSSGKIKIRLELSRTTKVDTKRTRFANGACLGFLDGTQALSEGVIEKMTRGPDWIAWSGVIVVSGDVKCGGFTACGVEVFDQLVLSILPTSSSRSSVISFCDGVPIKLIPRNTLTSVGSMSTLKPKRSKAMDYYPPPPTSSSVASNTSWWSSDGGDY